MPCRSVRRDDMAPTTEQLKARWKIANGKRRLKAPVEAVSRKEEWSALLRGFPHSTGVSNGNRQEEAASAQQDDPPTTPGAASRKVHVVKRACSHIRALPPQALARSLLGYLCNRETLGTHGRHRVLGSHASHGQVRASACRLRNGLRARLRTVYGSEELYDEITATPSCCRTCRNERAGGCPLAQKEMVSVRLLA